MEISGDAAVALSALFGAVVGGAASVITSYLAGKHQLDKAREDNKAAAALARDERDNEKETERAQLERERRQAAVRRCADFVAAMYLWVSAVEASRSASSFVGPSPQEVNDLRANAAQLLAQLQIEGPDVAAEEAERWFVHVVEWRRGEQSFEDERTRFMQAAQAFVAPIDS